MADNKQFVLGLDLDGVTFEYDEPFKAFVARELGNDPANMGVVTNWDLSKIGWGIRDTAHFQELHQKAVREGLFRNMKAMKDASERLRDLSHRGVYIRIITHRLFINGLHAQSASDTILALEAEKIPYRDICFVADKPQVGAHVYLEDSPTNVEKLRVAGDAIVFDQPYNQHLAGPRARNWDEAHSLILERFEAFQAQQ